MFGVGVAGQGSVDNNLYFHSSVCVTCCFRPKQVQRDKDVKRYYCDPTALRFYSSRSARLVDTFSTHIPLDKLSMHTE